MTRPSKFWFFADREQNNNTHRVTSMPGFDGLPAFSFDGKTMIWTSKRSGDEGSQLWVSGFDRHGGAESGRVAPPTGHDH